jgi:molybdate transport system substrate-binding protein
VLAASSLTEVFDQLATKFEADHPGVKVVPVYDSSATLATQVQQGAPADVLATADTTTMGTASSSGDVDKSVIFATNHMVLVTPPSNPAHIQSIKDLDTNGVSYVVCVTSAPCGDIAAKLLKKNHITAKPKSLEVDVKSVLTKVTSGEADAGFVYASDAVAAGKSVTPLSVPGSEQLRNSYPIAIVKKSQHQSLAQQWIDLVQSGTGQDALKHAGFGAP